MKNIVYGAIAIIGLSGCATFKSLNADVLLTQRIFIYSGTRLDWAALENDNVTIRKFKDLQRVSLKRENPAISFLL